MRKVAARRRETVVPRRFTAAAGGRRLCAVTEGHDGDAELAGLVPEICLDAAIAEDKSSSGEAVEHKVVTLERRSLGVPVEVGLEGDLRDLAGVSPLGGDQLGALGEAAVEEDHVGVLGEHLIELGPDQ